MNPVLELLTRFTGYLSQYHSLPRSEQTIEVVTPTFRRWQAEDEPVRRQLPSHSPYAGRTIAGFFHRGSAVTPIEQVAVHGNTGSVVVDGSIVADSMFDVSRLARSPAYRHPSRRPHRRHISGTVTSIFHLPWARSNIYHWFVDVLPRWHAIAAAHSGPLTVLIPTGMPAYQTETLEHLISGSSHIAAEFLTLGPRDAAICERYLFSRFVSWHQSGFLPSDVSSGIRAAIVSGYGVRPPERPVGRIFVSRAAAVRRMVANEQALHGVLREHGFDIVQAESLSYRDQVELFAQAAVVAGPHGAGLTNALFSRAHTLVELHPSGGARTHYHLMAKGLNTAYVPVFGSAADDAGNFTVDPSVLERALERLAE